MNRCDTALSTITPERANTGESKHRRGQRSYFPLTASFICFPGLKTGTSQAGISISSPVLGFLPILSALCLLEKVPKPGIATESPLPTVSMIVSVIAFRARLTASGGMSVAPDTVKISSAFVMITLLFLLIYSRVIYIFYCCQSYFTSYMR